MLRVVKYFPNVPQPVKGPTWLLNLNATIVSPPFLCPQKARLPPMSFLWECPRGRRAECSLLGLVEQRLLLYSLFMRLGAGPPFKALFSSVKYCHEAYVRNESWAHRLLCGSCLKTTRFPGRGRSWQ